MSSDDYVSILHGFDQSLGYVTHPGFEKIPFMSVEATSSSMQAINNLALPSEDTRIIYDMDAVITTANAAQVSFDNVLMSQLSGSGPEDTYLSPVLHCFAIKACPISYIIHAMVQQGLGCECASIIEVKQSLR